MSMDKTTKPQSGEAPPSLGAVAVPEPEGIFGEPFSRRKLMRMLRFFGPGALVASIAVGAGETILVTGVGAWAEYSLLWLILLSVLVKGVCVTYLLGRYTAVSGQTVGNALVRLPGPRGWFILGLLGVELAGLTLALTAVAKPCGNLMVYLMDAGLPDTVPHAVWENLVTTLFLGLALGLSLLTSYNILEKQQIVICGILVAGTVLATFVVWPSLAGMLTGFLRIGHLPPAPEWAPPAARNDYFLNLATVFGYVGGTISTYVAYAGWVGIRGWGLTAHPDIERVRKRADDVAVIDYLKDDPVEAQRMRTLLAPLKWDVAMSALVLLVVTVAFMVAGAVVLFPRHMALPGNMWDLLTKQSSIWAQIHTSLVPLYYVAILAALWGTLATIPEAVTRVTHEFLSAVWPGFASFPYRGLQSILVLWFFAASCVWIWSDVSFDLLTQIVALLTTNLGIALVCLAALYLNFRLPPRYRTRPLVLAFGVLSALLLLTTFVVSALGLWQKMG
jgi:Mn2+/Fe2+ NRAMP family transporter